MSRIQKKKPDKEKRNKKTEVVKKVTETGSGKINNTNITGLNKATSISTNDPIFFQRWILFLSNVKMELEKVTWPTKKQTIGTTIVLILFVFIVAAFLGFFDYSLSKFVQIVLT